MISLRDICGGLAAALAVVVGACSTAAASASAAPAPVVVAAATAPVLAPWRSTIPVGKSSFDFSGWAGKPFPVYLYRPRSAGQDAPIVFVMHGALRNGDVYRDDIAPIAEANGFIIVAPLISSKDFPGAEGYVHGGMTDRDGAAKPRETWLVSAIEPLFDLIRIEHGSSRTQYSIFGHSGGAQFVHRFLAAVPDARVDRAVAANSGWYTMPDAATAWPFGLGGAPFAADTAAWFASPMTVLLGTADTLRTENLNQTPEADAQGPHRLARGQTFFADAQVRAAADGVPFAWTLDFVEDVGHEHTPMAEGAVWHLLLPEDLPVEPAAPKKGGGG